MNVKIIGFNKAITIQHRRYRILVGSLTLVIIDTARDDYKWAGQQVDQEEINKYQQVQVWFGILIL